MRRMGLLAADRRFGRGCHHAFRAAGRTHRVGFCAVPVMPAGWLAEYGRLPAAGSSAWALEDWHGHRGQLRRLAPPRAYGDSMTLGVSGRDGLALEFYG